MLRWSAATARCSPRPGPPWRHGHDHGDRLSRAAPAAPGRRRGRAGRGPAAVAGTAPQHDAVAAAADRRVVVVRLLPAQHGRSAVLGAAHVLEHGAGPHDRRRCPVRAGVAAWMGSRDGRRGTADLLTAAARPRWAVQLTTWSATAIWAVGSYLVFVGVMFAVYA